MSDAGGQLAERGELFGLHQAVLRGVQILQRLGQFAGAGLHVFEQTCVLDRQHRLGGEGLHQVNGVLQKRAGRAAAHHQQANHVVAAQERGGQSRPEPGANGNLVNRVGSLFPQVGNLHRLVSRQHRSDIALLNSDMLLSKRVDQVLVHTVGGAQAEFAFHVVEHVDCAGLGVGKLHSLGDNGRKDILQVERRVHRLRDFAERAKLCDRPAKFVRALA